MKPFILFVSLIILISISSVAFINKKNDIPEHHLEIVLRDIGHQLLLSAKDSSSRVLPIKQLDDNTYQISFQSNFSFISDTLINIVERAFIKNALATDYVVNLKNCIQKETVLAFEINGQRGNLTPCKGRKLEVGCYVIEINFLKKSQFSLLCLLLLFIPLSFLIFYIKNIFRKKEEKEPIQDNNDYLPIGNFKFYPNNHMLIIEDKSIALSEKETKALKIFAENTNQIVEREKLIKEIWENDGIVVISRNVDVMVSKLRKKLSDDTAIKFINIHGKGYKFIIE